jgi:hypothetical protein
MIVSIQPVEVSETVKQWFPHIIVKDKKKLGGIIFVMSINSVDSVVIYQYLLC